MLFVVQFRDNPEMRHLRPKLLPAHLEFLTKNEATVRAAGSLRVDGDDRAIGDIDHYLQSYQISAPWN